MKGQFNEKIPAHREQQHLSLRQVAALHERDSAQRSKIEKGSRLLKRNQIPVLDEILKADEDELLTLWLSDRIYAMVKNEKMENGAMGVVKKKINLSKWRRN